MLFWFFQHVSLGLYVALAYRFSVWAIKDSTVTISSSGDIVYYELRLELDIRFSLNDKKTI